MKPAIDRSMADNLTGLARAPEREEQMLEATEEFRPTSSGGKALVAEERKAYVKNTMKDRKRDAKQVRDSEAAETDGESPNQAVEQLARVSAELLDKLGERLAFEASGVRLYEALISKFESCGGFERGPTLADLQELRADEHRHFMWLKEAIEDVGGDPSVLTKSANIAAVASQGIPKVLTDPNTDFLHCLEAMLVAELMDGDAWEGLVEMVRDAGEEAICERFEEAAEEEGEHLRKIRLWVAAGQGREESYRELAIH